MPGSSSDTPRVPTSRFAISDASRWTGSRRWKRRRRFRPTRPGAVVTRCRRPLTVTSAWSTRWRPAKKPKSWRFSYKEPPVSQLPPPEHIAIIMDGNSRWARERLLPRVMGHKAGIESIRRVAEAADQRGIRVLTLYAFSTENWSRPKDEVDALMSLFSETIRREVDELARRGIELRFSGRIHELSPALQDQMRQASERTRVSCRAARHSASPPLEHGDTGRHGYGFDRGRPRSPDCRLHLGLCGDGDCAGGGADRILATHSSDGASGPVVAALSAELRLAAPGATAVVGQRHAPAGGRDAPRTGHVGPRPRLAGKPDSLVACGWRQPLPRADAELLPLPLFLAHAGSESPRLRHRDRRLWGHLGG